MPSRVVVLPTPEFSDGSSQYWPITEERQSLVEVPTLYLEKIATMWMKEKGEAEPGVVYSFESLPAGYAVYEQPRLKDPKHADKRLYGFSKKYFDSPNRYFPHFNFVMNNQGSNVGCPCTVCASSKKQPGLMGPGLNIRPASTPKRRNESIVDEEGNQAVLRQLIDRLRTELKMNEPVEEPTTMDWRTTKTDLGRMHRSCVAQPSWIPRTGEVVLFLPDLADGQEVGYDNNAGHFVIRDAATKQPTGVPSWQAGVVTQVSTETLTDEDLSCPVNREVGVNYSGFKIECMSDPNDSDKSLSKQYKYVPMHLIRPFAFWQHLVKGIPDSHWHLTLFNAITAMASFCLFDKFRFRGEWPRAGLLAKGMYLGAELVLVGDAVTLFSSKTKSPATGPDDALFLHVSAVELYMDALDRCSDSLIPSTATVTGIVYTTNPDRVSAGGYLVDPSSHVLPRGLSDYPAAGIPIYLVHPLGKKIRVPFHRVVNRCYEATAMLRWFPFLSPDSNAPAGSSRPHPIATLGHDGMTYARLFSGSEMAQIAPSAGDGDQAGALANGGKSKKWFFANTRVEQLDLLSVNGIDVGRADKTRNPRAWRREIAKLLEDESHHRSVEGGDGEVESSNRTGRGGSIANGVNLTVQDRSRRGDADGDAEMVDSLDRVSSDRTVGLGPDRPVVLDDPPVGSFSAVNSVVIDSRTAIHKRSLSTTPVAHSSQRNGESQEPKKRRLDFEEIDEFDNDDLDDIRLEDFR